MVYGAIIRAILCAESRAKMGEKLMDRTEFEVRRAAKIRRLKRSEKNRLVKVADLIKMLQKENPSLRAVIAIGTHRLPVVSVRADEEHNVELCV